MVCKYLFREGIVIRRVKTFLCCFKLLSGIKFYIWFAFLQLCVSGVLQIIRITQHINGNLNWSDGLSVLDIYWSVFGGQVNLFTISMGSAQLLILFMVATSGIYAWIKQFQLKALEKYFYVSFTFTTFSFINSIVFQIMVSDDIAITTIQIILIGCADFYILSVIYSFLLETDEKYRQERKKTHKMGDRSMAQITSSSL